MYIDINTIITAASFLTSATVLFAAVFKVHKWYLKQEEQDKDIKKMKEEDTLICFALSACLDGLQQLGANHTVPIAREKLEKYLNKKAHE